MRSLHEIPFQPGNDDTRRDGVSGFEPSRTARTDRHRLCVDQEAGQSAP